MEKLRLLPMELPSASSINGAASSKSRMSFFRRLGLGCVVLAALGLLYVPVYHSAQGPLLGMGETSSFAGGSGSSRFQASVAQLPGWSFNTSRNLNLYIHPENSTTILNPVDACNPIPYLVIVVCSAVANFNSRMAIRNTWANASNLGPMYEDNVRFAFLLGESDNETLNNSIIDESLRYNDIIQEKFYDAYNNLTLKSVMMLKWITSNCQSATYLMKTDDDMFVNVPTLLTTLRARQRIDGTLIGYLICNARPISDPKNKWYTPKYMFSEKTYPNYLSGTGYVMSLDVAKKLYSAALSTPLLHLEDVYITGVCARSAKLKPRNHPGFSYVPRKLDLCVLQSAITAHKVNASTMHAIWNKLRDANVTACATNSSSESKKSITLNGIGRNVGYYFVKKRTASKCV